MKGHHKDSYKDDAIIAAQELGYGAEVVMKIIKAKSPAEVERIMIKARHEKLG